MRRIILLLAMATVLIGCGGGGGDEGKATTSNNIVNPSAVTPGSFDISMKADVGTVNNGAPLSIATVSRVRVYKGTDTAVTPIYDRTASISKGSTDYLTIPVSDCSNSVYSIFTTTGGSNVVGTKNAASLVHVACGSVTFCTNTPDISINHAGTYLELRAVNTARLSCTP